MATKKIEAHLFSKLDRLREKHQLLYIKLWASCDQAGILTFAQVKACARTLDMILLYPSDIPKINDLVMVQDYTIILTDYLSVNYGAELKRNYNPHSKAWKCIASHGLEYSKELNRPIFPKKKDPMSPSNMSISDISSSKIDSKDHSSMNGSLLGDRRSDGLILDFIKSDSLALYLSIGLMVVQSFHTSHALINMTTLQAPINYIFGILTALLMDSLILYFVANANYRVSFVFFLW